MGTKYAARLALDSMPRRFAWGLRTCNSGYQHDASRAAAYCASLAAPALPRPPAGPWSRLTM